MSFNIICIDDDSAFLTYVKAVLLKDYDLKTVTNLADGLLEIRENDIDLVLLDISLGDGENGIEGLVAIKRLSVDTDVVMLTGSKDPRMIVQSVRSGATDYLCKPVAEDELRAVVEKIHSQRVFRDRHNALVENLNKQDGRFRMLGTSPVFGELLERASCLKGYSNANILILGETGTGKELLARHIHSLEEDRRRPFIAVNCAAIPEGLIESELFGHERGSFTGANQRKIGKFELANGGDIFLDEISSLRLDLQAKILRVVQEKEIVRVGGTRSIPVEFRVISATNDNLMKKVEEGRFRLDLYHRLKVVDLMVPPLRERQEDIPLLVSYFLAVSMKDNKVKEMSKAAYDILQDYSWPGNIRELKNIVHSLCILSRTNVISESDLPPWMLDINRNDVLKGPCLNKNILELSEDFSSIRYSEFLRKAESVYIQRCLDKNNGDKTKTAEALEMSRANLYIKLKELSISCS